MKIEVGMYVRTKQGYIAKIKEEKIDGLIDIKYFLLDRYVDVYESKYLYEDKIDERVKSASHEIIDLVELGDYVNGIEIYSITKFNDGSTSLNDEPTNFCRVKSILTKEQFERRSYKVGEE